MKKLLLASIFLTGCFIDTSFSVVRWSYQCAESQIFPGESDYTCVKYEVEYTCEKRTPMFRRDAVLARCKTAEECEVKCNAARSEWEKVNR